MKLHDNQRRSVASREKRHANFDKDFDFYPTPLWATHGAIDRLLRLLDEQGKPKPETVWEPAAGNGEIAFALREKFPQVMTSDIAEYGFPAPYGDMVPSLKFTPDVLYDFVNGKMPQKRVDMIFTNPPFQLAAKFVKRGLEVADVVVLLMRNAFAEGQLRYTTIFYKLPPDAIICHSERVSMEMGRLNEKASGAAAYSWYIWGLRGKPIADRPPLYYWLPPGTRKRFESTDHYTRYPIFMFERARATALRVIGKNDVQ